MELDGATYAGFDLPFSITQLVWIEAILVGGAEIYRNTELDPEKRLYPGGFQELYPGAVQAWNQASCYTRSHTGIEAQLVAGYRHVSAAWLCAY